MNTIAQALTDNLISTLSAALLTVLIAAVGALTRWLHAKYHIDVSEATQEELNRAARDAVSVTSEVAHQVVKNVTSSTDTNAKPMTGEEKLHFAVGLLLDSAKKHNLTRARAEKLILNAVAGARKWGE